MPGRPKKRSRGPPPQPPPYTGPLPAVALPKPTPQRKKPKAKPSGSVRTDWSLPENAKRLDAAVAEWTDKTGDNYEDGMNLREFAEAVGIPFGT